MIVRQFISWIRTAPAGERAEATRALARAWLISDLSAEDRAAAEGALLMQLDVADVGAGSSVGRADIGHDNISNLLAANANADRPRAATARPLQRSHRRLLKLAA